MEKSTRGPTSPWPMASLGKSLIYWNHWLSFGLHWIFPEIFKCLLTRYVELGRAHRRARSKSTLVVAYQGMEPNGRECVLHCEALMWSPAVHKGKECYIHSGGFLSRWCKRYQAGVMGGTDIQLEWPNALGTLSWPKWSYMEAELIWWKHVFDWEPLPPITKALLKGGNYGFSA